MQNNYEIAFNKAAALLRDGDLDHICRRSGARTDGNRILITFLNEEYEIKLPEVSFHPPTLSLTEKILILHYLTATGRSSTKGEYISFKNLPAASFYDPAYRKRGPERILKRFGNNEEEIVRAAEKFGGSRAAYGDVSVKLDIFPGIQAVIVLYRGDAELPPEANILFNDAIINYLPLEDVTVISGIIASRLSKAIES